MGRSSSYLLFRALAGVESLSLALPVLLYRKLGWTLSYLPNTEFHGIFLSQENMHRSLS